MEENKKMNYKAPVIEVLLVELEEGIAGGSASSSTPAVDDSFAPGSGSTGYSSDESGF